MPEAILTLNAGSSSIKFALFRRGGEKRLSGAIDGIGASPHFHVTGPHGENLHNQTFTENLDHEQLLSPLLTWIETHWGDAKLAAAGHRIVHGGAAFHAPTLIDDNVLAQLDKLSELAPLHEPHNLAAIRALRTIRPALPQIGCFDTAFHRTMPDLVTRLPLPRHHFDEGIRRYGFHGLSYEYIARRLRETAPALAAGRVVAAHLGNGASACAMQNGQSIDSSMGFTALDGLIMGTRTGAIDPGVLLYLLQSRNMNAASLTDLLYKKSGLLGLSGIAADMRALLASPEPAASQAVNAFCLAAAKQIAALTVTLGGLDGLIFTAGIGEHAPEIRAAICARLTCLGAAIDPAANANANTNTNTNKITSATITSATIISAPNSRVEIRVIPTDEEAMIATHCQDALKQNNTAS